MSNKELIEDLNHLRIRYGTIPLYRTLIKLLRDEYEELSSLFCNTPNSNPTSTFYPTSPQDYYAEFMKASAEAAHDTLQEYTPVPTTFYDLETESLNDESAILEAEEFGCTSYNLTGCSKNSELTLEEEMKLIDTIFNNNSCWPSANPLSGGSASSEISPETPRGESADTPQETPLKIIQTCGASAAPEASPKKKLLKKKTPTTETVSVVKEETPAPIKKKKNTST